MEPLLVILAAVAVFAFLLGRIADRRSRGMRSGARFAGADPLLTACFGDHEKADRLAAYEQRKAPGISEDEARRRAWERLRADRER